MTDRHRSRLQVSFDCDASIADPSSWTGISKEFAMGMRSMHETQDLRVTGPAWLVAMGAPLWVTRDGDPDDHVLAPGQRLAVARGDRLWLGPWQAGERALWLWQPRGDGGAARYGWRRRLLAAPLAAAARALRGAADGLAALARRAAAMASRAQGCIKAGDSIASAGTVQ
jgi:hypothetical protein